ncbi:MAG TPA: acyl-CoA dehydrogenase family protein [Candidatus Dormibacteraeota bacterium]
MTATVTPHTTRPELDELRRTVARFVDREVRPVIDDWERRQRFPAHLMRAMGGLGLFGAAFPQAVGGEDVGKLAQCLIVEELARGSGGISTTCLVQVLALLPIAVHGDPAQRERYVVPGLRGEIAVCIAITEPGHGSDVAGIETTAVRDGDGWRLRGSKMFITNAPFADLFLVAAKTDPDGARRGISLFAVERGTPGLEVGAHLDKMGWHSSETAPVFLSDCRIPAENLVGQVGAGFQYIMEDFNFERLLLAAQCVGLAGESLAIALRYAQEREQFGRPITDFQAVRHKLARMATQVEAGRHLVRSGCEEQDAGGEGRCTASMAKYFCGEMVSAVAYDAIGVLGGAGYLRDHAAERIYRDARVLSIGGGTSEVQLNIIAKELLRE